ncbi:hypothetical protein F5B22DRAFT_602349 [Xylaria bambusicola]|uniref:uncharacterized protein n=1 Tax=Xylaria bambusicola TaxID=326684 RepID=UPI0020073BAC|nr:uncharacterized protein F5B22DRAFT_602349 [Xylaria bambusicola]KAI0517776.1 hypothetical protein F5B22DRAFT_602349 [Xylaria bambusicola]
MTEAKPNAGHHEHLHPVDATSQARQAGAGTATATDGVASQGLDKSGTVLASGDGRVADSKADNGSEIGDKVQDEEDDEEEEEESDDESDEDEDEDEDDEEEEEDDEPRLKYARLTQHLAPVYRNGDSTSAFLVAGDKMIVGTHKGNIHVIQLPTFQSLIAYHAHDASVTSISISPYPPPALPATLKPEALARATAQAASRPPSQHTDSSPARQSRKLRELPQVPNLPSNNIFIATSSMDGLVRVQSLLDLKDCQLRNFARPVQAVAVSPEYKSDRTYLSGGRAGNLVLTIGAPQGRSTSTTVGTAAAAASGWLGSMGLGNNTGKDTILHSGEGAISTIKWSLSGRYVVWLNEHGMKIMRTKLHLESADAEDAWKRIGHIDRPHTDEWEEMAGFWEGRAEWIDDQALGSGDDEAKEGSLPGTSSPATTKLTSQAKNYDKSIERLIVGWGGTIWIIHVHPGSVGSGENDARRSAGRAEIAKILRMDCIISGISLYTQNLLLVLAYCNPEEEDDDDDGKNNGKSLTSDLTSGHETKLSTTSKGSGPSSGIRHRRNALRPELRLIDLVSQVEVDKSSPPINNFQGLSSNDYHLGVLPASRAASVAASRGALEALAGFGNEMWNAAINPISLFSSGASIRSKNSNDAASRSQAGNAPNSMRAGLYSTSETAHPNLVKPGAKLFIHSPYDCILATKRDLSDHLAWLLEREKYEDAWELLDEHPEIVTVSEDPDPGSVPTVDPKLSVTDEFSEETSSVIPSQKLTSTPVEREKQRIGELWIQELLDNGDWDKAARIVGMAVQTPDRWEKWVYTFAGAKKFDEIVNYIPSEPMHPPIPGTIYEIVLGHYLRTDKPRFKELLERWGPDLFSIQEVATALENTLKFRDVREDSIEGGEKGRDWRIVMESLAHLHELNGKHRDALKCYIKLQDADSAMRLIKENHLADAVADDVASFIALRVPEAYMSQMNEEELAEATSEAITLLVDETQRGLIRLDTVVSQLEKKSLNLYLYFYFRGLWHEYRERPVDETISLIDEYADLAVHIFVLFNRELLMDFLRISTSYTFERAVQECEHVNYIPELVYLYSKTGQMKRALYLIIDRLGDVSQAIGFAKEQDDPDLWEDLLEYSMDKPRFIRGLLEEVGTSINPITLVRRIPEGLEIPGLREGLKHIMKEHEIQYSISSGVARVLRSEVVAAQSQLRSGQRKGIKFDVMIHSSNHVDIEAKDVPNISAGDLSSPAATPRTNGSGTPATVVTNTALSSMSKPGQQPGHDHREPQPGHCAQCHEPFSEWETETLLGFACGHVFHVTHLLEALHPGQDTDPTLAGNGDLRRSRGGRFVGSKVTHARLLRDRVENGCPVCKSKRQAVGQESHV